MGVAVLVAAAALALRGRERALAAGLGAVLAFGLLAGLWFRQRDYGWYFEFKALAFIAPLVLAAAVAGAARWGRFAAVPIALLVLCAQAGARDELRLTGPQPDRTALELRDWARALPAGASVRLDVPPGGDQLWAGYFLARQPLCSLVPLLKTSYPHVPYSVRADYAVEQRGTWVEHRILRSGQLAAGPPLRQNDHFSLYRLRPGLPGPDLCSRRMVQTVTHVGLS